MAAGRKLSAVERDTGLRGIAAARAALQATDAPARTPLRLIVSDEPTLPYRADIHG